MAMSNCQQASHKRLARAWAERGVCLAKLHGRQGGSLVLSSSEAYAGELSHCKCDQRARHKLVTQTRSTD